MPALPRVTVQSETELDDDILEAMSDATDDADGRSSAYYLRHHLAKRGLLIVEASRLGRMKLAMELIVSAAAELVKMES